MDICLFIVLGLCLCNSVFFNIHLHMAYPAEADALCLHPGVKHIGCSLLSVVCEQFDTVFIQKNPQFQASLHVPYIEFPHFNYFLNLSAVSPVYGDDVLLWKILK